MAWFCAWFFSMSTKAKYASFLIIFFFLCSFINAQQTKEGKILPPCIDPSPVLTCQIGNIKISGNKKTRNDIILRELPFRSGEEYQLTVFNKRLEDAQRQLMNTTLFQYVILDARNNADSTTDILVTVKERWYIFPLPYFKPVDRNL